MKTNIKEVKLYAYSVYSSESKLTVSHATLTKWLSEKLKDSTLDKRCMVLNSMDKDSDEDFIGDFSDSKDNEPVFGTLFRMTPSENIPSFTDDILKQTTISLSQLENLLVKSGGKKAYKNHLYFYITDEVIITNSSSAKKLEVYLNWYLKDYLTDISIDIRPRVEKVSKTTLGSLKKVNIAEPKKVNKGKSTEMAKSSTTVKTLAIVDAVKDKVLSLLMHDYGLDKLTADNFNDVVRVQLSILIAQNTDLLPNEEAARKTLESVLNVVQNDAIEFVGPNGQRIKSEEMKVGKTVQIELNSNGFLNEHELYSEMKKFRLTIN